MSDDEQLKAEGAEESAPRIPSPPPPDVSLFDDVANEPLEPIDIISSTLPARVQELIAPVGDDAPPGSDPQPLDPSDIQPDTRPSTQEPDEPSSVEAIGARGSRPRIMLKIPDDAIPASSPLPPDVDEARARAPTAGSAVIHAMRIIAVGEPPPPPPEPEPEEEIEPEDDASALDMADVQSTWTPPGAQAAPPHPSSHPIPMPEDAGSSLGSLPATAESSMLDDDEIEPDSDIPDAPLAAPLGTAERWDIGALVPSPSPPIVTIPASPSASAPPPPSKASTAAGRQALRSQPAAPIEPTASPTDEEAEELTDEEVAPDSMDHPGTQRSASAWGSQPIAPVQGITIREGSGETPAAPVVGTPGQSPVYGRTSQPDGFGLEAAAQQAMSIDLSMPESPPPAPRAAPPPPREQTPSPRPQEARAEERPMRRGRRTRPGWEEVFSDEFVRSYKRLTPVQVGFEVSFIEESLGVQRGGVMLDLGCGMGQHAVELAARGYNVVGYDLSLTMLALAADEAQERAQKINFLQGDMREMAFEEMFDGVYSWATSFGFFDEEKNASVIRRVHRSLRKGGLFLLDLVNRDYIVARLPALAWFEGDGCVCIDDAQFDSITSRLRVKRTIMLEDGTSKEVEYSVRLYSLHEIGRVLHEAGFKVVEVSGHPATPGAFFDAESPRVITLAERR